MLFYDSGILLQQPSMLSLSLSLSKVKKINDVKMLISHFFSLRLILNVYFNSLVYSLNPPPSHLPPSFSKVKKIKNNVNNVKVPCYNSYSNRP